MINLFHQVSFINDPRIFQILLKGMRNVINTILKIGSYYKSKEEIQEYSDYTITNKRKIVIKTERRDFSQYKYLFNQMSIFLRNYLNRSQNGENKTKPKKSWNNCIHQEALFRRKSHGNAQQSN